MTLGHPWISAASLTVETLLMYSSSQDASSTYITIIYHNNIYKDLCSAVSLMIFIVLADLRAWSHPPIWPQSWQQQRHWLVLPLWPQWPHCISVSFISVELHSYCWGNSSIRVQHVFQTCYTAGWMTGYAVELVKKHFALYNTHGFHYFWFPTLGKTVTNAVKLQSPW